MRIATLASLLFLLGCGSEGKEAPVSADANSQGDATLDRPPACEGLLPSYDLSGASFSGYARPRDAGNSESPTVYGLFTVLDQGPTTDLFEIQLWNGLGVFNEGVVPGTFAIQGADTDLNDCGLCALVFGDLAANGSTNTVLVAQSGSVTIEAVELQVGAAFRGSATQLDYRQVNSGGVIPDGCGLSVSNISFDVTLDAP